MRPALDHTARAWPLGSPVGYVQGAVLLLVAAGFAYALMVSTHLRPDDRFILAIVAVLTIGPFGIVAILRPAVRCVLLERDRVCIREWTFERRCVALDRIRRVTWSYQYVSHFLDRIDRGRAWVELEIVSETGRRAHVVIDYGGRARHEQISEFLRELALRAHLRRTENASTWASSTEGEVVWER